MISGFRGGSGAGLFLGFTVDGRVRRRRPRGWRDDGWTVESGLAQIAKFQRSDSCRRGKIERAARELERLERRRVEGVRSDIRRWRASELADFRWRIWDDLEDARWELFGKFLHEDLPCAERLLDILIRMDRYDKNWGWNPYGGEYDEDGARISD